MSDLTEAVRWVADHWDAVPDRIHRQGVDDQSEWGAPPYSTRMEQWLSANDTDAFYTTVQTACDHQWTKGNRIDCPDCAGSGTRTTTTKQFRYPMRAALHRLRKRVHMPPRTVHYADAIYRLALLDWNVEATCAALGMTNEKGEAFLAEAIRRVRFHYDERPNVVTARKSENQQIAEAVAA